MAQDQNRFAQPGPSLNQKRQAPVHHDLRLPLLRPLSAWLAYGACQHSVAPAIACNAEHPHRGLVKLHPSFCPYNRLPFCQHYSERLDRASSCAASPCQPEHPQLALHCLRTPSGPSDPSSQDHNIRPPGSTSSLAIHQEPPNKNVLYPQGL